MELKSIKQEAADCRRAFKNFKGKYVVHCHHQSEFEKLTESAENRIAYILSDKPKDEQALRLRLFRPITDPALAEYNKILLQAHKKICKAKNCPWNGNIIIK
jgi:hypothetical protein